MLVRLFGFIVVFFLPPLSIILSQGFGRAMYVSFIIWCIAVGLFFEYSVVISIVLYLFVVFHALYFMFFSKNNNGLVSFKGVSCKDGAKNLAYIGVICVVFITGIVTFESRINLEKEVYLDHKSIAKGRDLFKSCQTCHRSTSRDSNFVGPHLVGIMGRRSASLKDYKYSEGLMKSNLVWGDENLVQFLQNPIEFIPGTRMATGGLSKEEASNIVIYLKSK